MFFINLFYNTQEIHKLLIHKSYNDITVEINIFNNKYPDFKGYIMNDDYNNQNIEIKKEWDEYIERVDKLKQIIINNLLTYCKNYPDSKISKNRFILEYKEYTYRLEQNLDEVILEL